MEVGAGTMNFDAEMQKMFNTKTNVLQLDDCSAFPLYVLTILYFARKCSCEEYGYSEIGRGFADAFARFNVDRKVLSDKFNSIEDSFDKVMAWLNNGDMTFRDEMINYVSTRRGNYFKEKMASDLTAIYVFFEVPKCKLSYKVDGKNVLADWKVD